MSYKNIALKDRHKEGFDQASKIAAWGTWHTLFSLVKQPFGKNYKTQIFKVSGNWPKGTQQINKHLFKKIS